MDSYTKEITYIDSVRVVLKGKYNFIELKFSGVDISLDVARLYVEFIHLVDAVAGNSLGVRLYQIARSIVLLVLPIGSLGLSLLKAAKLILLFPV